MMTEINTRVLEAYVKGETELKEILGLESAYLEDLKGRAQLFLDGGHHQRALMMLEMIEELDRRDLTPSLLAFQILLQQGHSDAAEKKLNTMLERHPQHPDAQVALAEYQIAVGQLVPAAETLGGVIQGDPHGTTAAGKRARALAAAAHDRLESA